MNARELKRATGRGMDAVAENVFTRLLARLSMALAGTVLLPLIIWLGHRAVDTMDQVQGSLVTLAEGQEASRLTLKGLQGQYEGLAGSLARQQVLLYPRSEAEKELDWQKVRDSGQDEDRRRLEKQVGKRLDGDEGRILRLEGKGKGQ